jgi:flagellar biosynthesis/type III secretory pathway chaperone
MAAFLTDVLSDLIRQKHRCLEHLSAMGRKQLDLVRGDATTDLLDVLAAKQRVLFQLQRIERELDPFRHQDPEERSWRSPEERTECAAIVAACEALLGEIIARERQSEAELIERRDEAAARLEGTHTASAARSGYLAPSRARVGQLDVASEG